MKAIILCLLSSGFVSPINAQSNNSAPVTNNSKAENAGNSNEFIQQNKLDTAFQRNNTPQIESISTSKKELKSREKVTIEMKEVETSDKKNSYEVPANEEEKMNLTEDAAISTQGFEQNLAIFSTSNYDMNKASNLFLAAQLQPENLEVQKQLMAYYFITNKDLAFDSLAEKVNIKEGRAAADYSYFNDLCSSVSQNSTLILHGVTDFNLNYQTRECYEKLNVELVSFEYLASKEYQNQLKTKGFKLPQATEFNPAYLQSFCELNQEKNIYLSMTFPKEFLKPIQKNIVPVGLSFHYGFTSNSNEINQSLWQNSWKKNITSTKLTTFSDGLAKNYIPSLLVLRKHYVELGYSDEIKLIDEKIRAIGKRSNIPEETIQLLIK